MGGEARSGMMLPARTELPSSNSLPTAERARHLGRYPVGIEQDRAFNVMRRLLGPGGSNIKGIAQESGARIHIGGRDSGHRGGLQCSSNDDESLAIFVSASSRAGLQAAANMTSSLLERVHREYRNFCHRRDA